MACGQSTESIVHNQAMRCDATTPESMQDAKAHEPGAAHQARLQVTKAVHTSVRMFPRRKGLERDSKPLPQRGRSPVALDLAAVQALFPMPQQDAATKLGISLTSLKHVCRELGLKRWPYHRSKGVRAGKNHSSQTLSLDTNSQKFTRKACKDKSHASAHLSQTRLLEKQAKPACCEAPMNQPSPETNCMIASKQQAHAGCSNHASRPTFQILNLDDLTPPKLLHLLATQQRPMPDVHTHSTTRTSNSFREIPSEFNVFAGLDQQLPALTQLHRPCSSGAGEGCDGSPMQLPPICHILEPYSSLRAPQ